MSDASNGDDIFYVIGNIQDGIPSWIPPFRTRYDSDYARSTLEMTLKDATTFQTDSLPDMRNLVQSYAKRYATISLAFTGYQIGTTAHGHSVMLQAEPSDILHELQHDMVRAFSMFGQLKDPAHKAFEEQFIPHITIAHRLSGAQLKSAKQLLPATIGFTASVSDLSLVTFRRSSSDTPMQLHQYFTYPLTKAG